MPVVIFHLTKSLRGNAQCDETKLAKVCRYLNYLTDCYILLMKEVKKNKEMLVQLEFERREILTQDY